MKRDKRLNSVNDGIQEKRPLKETYVDEKRPLKD